MTLRACAGHFKGRAQGLFIAGVAFLLTKGWCNQSVKGTQNLTAHIDKSTITAGSSATTVAQMSVEDFNKVKLMDWQQVANLSVALKLTWWMMNHHVGQDEADIAGFVGKIAKIIGAWVEAEGDSEENKDVRSALWILGKLMVTRRPLASIGITGIDYSKRSNRPGAPTGGAEDEWDDIPMCLDSAIDIKVSEDVKLRVESNPAGTAGLFTYWKICDKASRSIFSCAVPVISAYNPDRAQCDFRKAMDIVKVTPARYHMGSLFLSGQERLVLDPASEEDKEHLSAFIHASSPGSHLADAKVIKTKAEVKGTITYTVITGIKGIIAKGTGNIVAMKYVSKLTGGSGLATGGLGVQSGKITAADAQAVEDELKADAAKKSTAATGSAIVPATGPTAFVP